MAQLVENNSTVMTAYDELQRFSSNEEMRDLERRRRRFLEDQRIYVGAAREAKASEIARNMKREGFETAIVARMTGLSRAEIERLD